MAVNRACQYCSERFETNQTKRLFCSDKCKTRYHRSARLTCWYCGEMANTVDHLYPCALGDGVGDTVYACRECNSTLGLREGYSVARRCKVLFKAYVKKYKLHTFIPEWDDGEIAEIKGSLKKYVRGRIYQRQQAMERVEHIRARFVSLEESTFDKGPEADGVLSDDDDESFFVIGKRKSAVKPAL